MSLSPAEYRVRTDYYNLYEYTWSNEHEQYIRTLVGVYDDMATAMEDAHTLKFYVITRERVVKTHLRWTPNRRKAGHTRKR